MALCFEPKRKSIKHFLDFKITYQYFSTTFPGCLSIYSEYIFLNMVLNMYTEMQTHLVCVFLNKLKSCSLLSLLFTMNYKYAVAEETSAPGVIQMMWWYQLERTLSIFAVWNGQGQGLTRVPLSGLNSVVWWQNHDGNSFSKLKRAYINRIKKGIIECNP